MVRADKKLRKENKYRKKKYRKEEQENKNDNNKKTQMCKNIKRRVRGI